MSASKPMKEVTMKKARVISVIASLCLLAFSFAGACAGTAGHSHDHGGGGGGGIISWFDGL
jgi:hypothetical protein